jgi:nucleoside-diphosphate-sugar epimerase
LNAVLVTGASGFIGQALCGRLVRDGFRVRGTFRPTSNPAPGPDIEKFLVGDIAGDNDYPAMLDGVGTVVHLAARVHVMGGGRSMDEYRRLNAAGTARLAEAAARMKVRRFVYVSTIKVNGEESPAPYRESDEPSPRDPYGISKWEAEQALRKISADTGLETVILRPPLVYGPGVKANFLNLIRLVERGVPLPLASIRNLRSFVLLGNLVDALCVCAVHPAAAGATFMVSDGRDVSTPEIIRMIAAGLKLRPALVPCPVALLGLLGRLAGKGGEIARLTGSLRLDISKIKTELGWNPPYTMEEGIEETVKWYKAS